MARLNRVARVAMAGSGNKFGQPPDWRRDERLVGLNVDHKIRPNLSVRSASDPSRFDASRWS